MSQMKSNIINSFRLAKNDIMKLQSDVIGLSQSQERIVEILEEMKTYQLKLYHKIREMELEKAQKKKPKTITKTKTVIKKVGKRAKKVYVAPKGGKKFHLKECPFAQNIKPKNKVVFHSKTKALNEGLKPCKCVK